MMLKIRVILYSFCLVFCNQALSQDLTGIWRGHFKSALSNKYFDSLGIEDRYKFETQIAQNNKAFEGVTYSYKTTVFYGKASCVGTISTKTKRVILGENQLLEVKSVDGGACLMTCFLQYSKVGEEEFLEGTYTSISVRDSTQCGGGTVFLRKVPNSDFYKEPFLAEAEKKKQETKITPKQPEAKQPEVAKSTPESKPETKTPPPSPTKKTTSPPPTAKKPATNPPKPTAKTTPGKKPEVKKVVPEARNKEVSKLTTDTPAREVPTVKAPVPIPRVLATRKNELVKTILSSAKQISVKIYDNGTVDNDTVSVYIDNKLVISKQRLTEKAITVTVNLDDDMEFHELVMVAENLGEIPPNTSLMVVDAGDQQHEVRITSTEQKNAVVRFARAK